MKSFEEALKDGFTRVTEVTDKETLTKLRQDGVDVDGEGYYSFLFGDNKEYELRIEPILREGCYAVALYKSSVLITERVPVKALRKEDVGA